MEGTQNMIENPETDVRPFKRRKFYRKRADTEDEAINKSVIESPHDTSPESLTLDELISRASTSVDDVGKEESGEPLSVAQILRHRKGLHRRKGGIEFTNTSNDTKVGPSEPPTDVTLSGEHSAVDKIMTVVDRFAPQTGQVADVDQHMMSYIDSEMAKRSRTQNALANIANSTTAHPVGKTIDADVQRQPAALGKLQEVDLGPDATSLNISRTEAAQRRLQGGNPEPEEVPGKVRLGKDGKPRRPRRRRNSGDIHRDRLVEEVLRENKLEIYDEPEIELSHDDQEADDRMAEQFRKEFMDAISERRQRMSHPSKKTGTGASDDKKSRGPKLGGSRSARAAMRELQEKAVKK